jgi:hypothetical protein
MTIERGSRDTPRTARRRSRDCCSERDGRASPAQRSLPLRRLCDSAALASDRRKAIVAVGDVARLRIRVVRRHEVVPPPSERRGPLAVARRAAVSSPARVCRVRLYEPHKPGDRPVAADVTAEYDFRVRTEEKRAVALAAVALLVQSATLGLHLCSRPVERGSREAAALSVLRQHTLTFVVRQPQGRCRGRSSWLDATVESTGGLRWCPDEFACLRRESDVMARSMLRMQAQDSPRGWLW